MLDQRAPHRSRSPSMGFPRRLPKPGGCEALELTARLTKLILDLVALVERGHLSSFAPRYPMDHAFCQPRSSVFTLFLLSPASPFVPTVGQRTMLLIFCSLTSSSLRIPWDLPSKAASDGTLHSSSG